MAVKGNHHQTGGDAAVGDNIVKFAWLVKDNIAAFQGIAVFPGYGVNFTFIYTEKFPKIMTLSRKGEITHIVEIMNRNNTADGQACMQQGAFIGHKTS